MEKFNSTLSLIDSYFDVTIETPKYQLLKQQKRYLCLFFHLVAPLSPWPMMAHHQILTLRVRIGNRREHIPSL